MIGELDRGIALEEIRDVAVLRRTSGDVLAGEMRERREAFARTVAYDDGFAFVCGRLGGVRLRRLLDGACSLFGRGPGGSRRGKHGGGNESSVKHHDPVVRLKKVQRCARAPTGAQFPESYMRMVLILSLFFLSADASHLHSPMVDDDHHIVENDSRLLAVRKSVGKCRHPSSDTFGVGRADRYCKHVISLRKSQGFTRSSFRQESAAVRDPENDEAPRPMQDKGLSGISFMHARRRADCVRHSSTAPLMPEVTSLA